MHKLSFLRSRGLWLRVAWGTLTGGFALALTPLASADEVVNALRPSAALTTERDPWDFAATLSPAMTRPVVALDLEDAVARELLRSSRTLSEADALRTAITLVEEARRLEWDPLLFVAVIHIESDYDHLAISNRGAEGLMQLMPETAEWMAERLAIDWPDSHSFDPALNVKLGAQYLAHLSHQFRNLDQTLTAYNRGPKATRYILHTHGRLPPPIRDFYAAKVLKRYRLLRETYGHLTVG